MKVTVAIIDQNKIYLKRLTKYFNDNYNDRVELCAFSTALSFFAFLDKTIVDIVIANENFSFEEIEEKLEINSVFVKLIEHPAIITEKYEFVFKYISCDNLYRYILNLASEKLLISGNCGQEELMTTSIISSQNYRLEFISALAYAFSKKEEVLFLDLTSFAAINYLQKHDENYMLSDLIIKMRNTDVDSSIKLEAYINKLHESDGIREIDFLSGFDNSCDLIGLTEGDFLNILKNVKCLNKYKNLIIFTDGYFDNFLQNIILNCDKLVSFKLSGKFSEFIEKKIEDNLKYFENINSVNSSNTCYEQLDIEHLNFEGDIMDVLSRISGDKIWIKSKN